MVIYFSEVLLNSDDYDSDNTSIFELDSLSEEEIEEQPSGNSCKFLFNYFNNSLAVLGTTFNFVNSIVGAGLIGLPYAVRECGFYLGIFMLIAVTQLTYISVVTLITCGIENKKYGYETLVKHLFGSYGYLFVIISMMLAAFGSM